MLLLKRHLVQLVREGKKRQTIRFWSRLIVRAGQISYTPGLGRMKILAVERVESLAALTEEDARADGFANRAALLAEIENIYGKTSRRAAAKKTPRNSGTVVPKVPRRRVLYRVRFQWPIDAAGEALVIGSVPAAFAKTGVPAGVRRDTKMSRQFHRPSPRKAGLAAQLRQALCAFIILRAPRV